MQGDLLIIGLGIAVAGLGSWIAVRASLGSGGLWPAAWALLLLGIGVDNLYPSPLTTSIGNLFGTLFAGLILAGAIRFTGRPLPRWLLPGAVALGIVRAGLARVGETQFAGLIAVFPEPIAELVAAFFVWRYTAGRVAPLAQRLLAPALVGLVGIDLWTGLIEIGDGDRGPLALAWLLTAALLSGLQLLTFLDQLKRRIRERTDELAGRNAELDAEIEERVRAEDELRLSRERYRKLSKLNSDFSFVVRLLPDRSWRLEWMTGAFERITGYSIEDMAKLGWNSFVHPEDLEAMRARFEDAEPEEPVDFEFRIFCKDGSVRWVEQYGLAESAHDGGRLLYASTHDVTWRKLAEVEKERLEARMSEAQRLESLGVLAGGVAHDFNNLLTVILGNTAMVLGDLPEDSPHRERLERIRKTADYAASLTSQMLAYAGSAVLTPKPLDLSRLTEDMLGLLQSELPVGVELRTDFAANLPRIEGDDSRVRQIVLNLVTNAGEALEDSGGLLRVETGSTQLEASDLREVIPTSSAEPGRYLYLEVSDDGPGMDEATKARIFEPFYTTKSFAPGRKVSGRGLGLAAVLGIVRGHGGLIEIDSALGEGTRFRVLLPVREEVAVAAPSPSVKSRDANGLPATVLVVDDDEMVREVAFEFLRRAGFKVLLAASGQEALDLVDQHGLEIRLLLLDFVMPDMDGETVLERVRLQQPGLPVVAVTGYSQAEGRRESLRLSGYLEKPYDPDELVALVREALSE